MIYDESHIPQLRVALLDSLTLTETLGGHAHERKRSHLTINGISDVQKTQAQPSSVLVHVKKAIPPFNTN